MFKFGHRHSGAMLKIGTFNTGQKIFILSFGAFQVQIHNLVDFQTSAVFGSPDDHHPREDSITY